MHNFLFNVSHHHVTTHPHLTCGPSNPQYQTNLIFVSICNFSLSLLNFITHLQWTGTFYFNHSNFSSFGSWRIQIEPQKNNNGGKEERREIEIEQRKRARFNLWICQMKKFKLDWKGSFWLLKNGTKGLIAKKISCSY